MYKMLKDISGVLEDAAERMTKAVGHHIYADSLLWFGWPQAWANTNCGFAGPGATAVTIASTVICGRYLNSGIGPFMVYHNGRFAYTVSKPSKLFWDFVAKRTLPGGANTDIIDLLEDK